MLNRKSMNAYNIINKQGIPTNRNQESMPHAPSLLVNDILEGLLGIEHMAKKSSFTSQKIDKGQHSSVI